MRLEEAKNQESGAEDAREGAYGCLRGREKEPRQEDRKETMESGTPRRRWESCKSGKKMMYLNTGTEL